jgi:hypothetical protein
MLTDGDDSVTMETGGALHRNWGKLKIGPAQSSLGWMVASRGTVERAHTRWSAWWRKRGDRVAGQCGARCGGNGGGEERSHAE